MKQHQSVSELMQQVFLEMLLRVPQCVIGSFSQAGSLAFVRVSS